MGSITLVVEEQHEFEQDERDFERGYNRRTRDLAEAQDSDVYRLHLNYCFECGRSKGAKVHKGQVTCEVEVPGPVEDMYEAVQKADSSFFDVAEETQKRGWQAMAVLTCLDKAEGPARACVSDHVLLLNDTNWDVAIERFRAVEGGRWEEFKNGDSWLGRSYVVIFDPTHEATAQVAADIDDVLGLDGESSILDEEAFEQAKRDQLAEYLMSGHLREPVPNHIDIDEVVTALRQLDGDDYWDENAEVTLAMVQKVVKEIPHQFDEGFDQETDEDDSPYLCVCGLKTTAEIHREEVPGQEKIEFEEGA